MVILIIGILFGLITSAIKRSVINARIKLVQSNMQTLANAVKTYRHEYRVWPLPSGMGQPPYSPNSPIKFGGTNGDNSAVVSLLKSSANQPINFLGNGDYVWNSANTSIVNPTNTRYAFIFEFDLYTDTVKVY